MQGTHILTLVLVCVASECCVFASTAQKLLVHATGKQAFWTHLRKSAQYLAKLAFSKIFIITGTGCSVPDMEQSHSSLEGKFLASDWGQET